VKTILVIDVGGTHVKLRCQGNDEVRKCPSGLFLTPSKMVEIVKSTAADWKYNRVTIGYPGAVVDGSIAREPVNLAEGWIGFDFASALGCPVKIVNDAAMQALGSYDGGRMLFLGLGTGLGTALIFNNFLLPMELGHLPYKKGLSFEDYVGQAGMKRLGRRKWQQAVFDVVARLRAVFMADYVVLGGGNVKKMDELPPNCRMGDNRNAFLGGLRMWDASATK
jgi:predicted NBD/HSP70 family sugar kinase